MSTYYETWRDNLRAEVKKEESAMMKKVLLLCPLACIVVFAVIALAAGGGMDYLLQNALIGLGLGAFADLMAWLFAGPSVMKKKFESSFKKDVEEQLTQEEREELARQMSRQEGTEGLLSYSWKADDWSREKVRFTKDFVMLTSDVGKFSLISLNRVERIEVDTHVDKITSRSSGLKLIMKTVSYPMTFYYKNSKKDWYDAIILFKDRVWRDEALSFIQKCQQETEK